MHLIRLCLFHFHYFYVYISYFFLFFFFNDTATTEIYTLSLHDALPIALSHGDVMAILYTSGTTGHPKGRSEEHTSELQSLRHLVCRLLLEKKKKKQIQRNKCTIK